MAFKPSSDLTVAPSTSGGQVRAGGGLRAAHSRPLRDAPSVVPAGEFSRNPRAVARCRFIAPAYLPRRFREERSAVFLFLLCFVRRKFGFVFRFLGAYPRDFVRSKRGDNLLNLDPSTSACTEYGQSALSYLRSAPTHPPYSCALFASTAVAPEMGWGSDAGGGGLALSPSSHLFPVPGLTTSVWMDDSFLPGGATRWPGLRTDAPNQISKNINKHDAQLSHGQPRTLQRGTNT